MSGLGELFSGRTVLITGAGGMLGRAYREVLAAEAPSANVLAWARRELDVTDETAVLAAASARPDFVVHCAADVNADRCEDDPDGCRRVQVGGTSNVVALAASCGARVLYPQSFLIYDGRELPITERTAPAPLSVYGRCKLEAEQLVLSRLPSSSVVVRMAGFFGGEEVDKNFVGKFARHLASLLAAGTRSFEVGDRVWQPTWTVDLARNSLALLGLGRTGTYNMASHGEATFHDVALECVRALGFEQVFELRRVAASSMASRERAVRPPRAIMLNERLRAEGLDGQREWRPALREYLSRPWFESLFEGVRRAV